MDVDRVDMQLGIYLDLRGSEEEPWAAVYERALGLCERVDETDATSIWLSEHHGYPDGYLPQPLAFAAAIAARTRRVRIGTAVLLAPLRHPQHVAEEAATVDILSSGRLDLGLGGGSRAAEFAMFGMSPPKAPLRSLFEARDAIRSALGSGRVTPPPVQPDIPLWLGCGGPLGVRRVGREGSPLLSVRRPLWQHYRAGLIEGGHDVERTGRMSGSVNVFLSDAPLRDRDVVARAYQRLWDTYDAAQSRRDGGSHSNLSDMDAALAAGLDGASRGLVIATVEEAAELLLNHFRGMPVDTVFTWASLLGLPHELADRHLQLWTQELPALVSDLNQ